MGVTGIGKFTITLYTTHAWTGKTKRLLSSHQDKEVCNAACFLAVLDDTPQSAISMALRF